MQGTIYAWQSALQDAIRERNPDEMGAKIRQAEVTIGRLMAVSYSLGSAEVGALSEALARVRTLQSEARHALIKWKLNL